MSPSDDVITDATEEPVWMSPEQFHEQNYTCRTRAETEFIMDLQSSIPVSSYFYITCAEKL